MPEQHPNEVPRVKYNAGKEGDGLEVNARWWMSETPGRDMLAVVKKLDQDQSYRRRMNTVFDRLYTGRRKRNVYDGRVLVPMVGEDPFSLGSRLGLNVVEAVIDTIASKIAKNRPRSYLLTEGGTWTLQKQAKQLMKFLDGLRLAQGVYNTGRRAFTDAMVFGTGHVKVAPDYESGDVCIERSIIDSVIINDAEAAGGRPRTMYQKHLLHRASAEEQLTRGKSGEKADKVKNAIAHAQGWDAAREQADDTSDMIWVYEGWSLRGKHVIAVDHEDGEIACNGWDKAWHPFAKVCWRNDTAGYWGIGLAEDLIGIQTEINDLLLRIQQAHGLMAVIRIFTKPGAKLKKNQFTNEMAIILECEETPTVHQGATLPDAVYKHLWDLFQKAFEIAGVSLLDATGAKPAGLNAAVALQEYRDIGTERFVLPGQDYEQLYVDIDRLAIRTAREMYENKSDVRVRAMGTKFIETISWSKVNIDEDSYELKPWPTSIMPATPSGRLQRVQELYQAGLIPDRETALSLLDAPDLEATLSLQLSAIDDVKRILELITDQGQYEPPEPFINLELGARMAQATFLKMRQLKEFPEARLDMLVRFADACSDMMANDNALPQPTGDPSAAAAGQPTGAQPQPQQMAPGAGVTPAALPGAAPPPITGAVAAA